MVIYGVAILAVCMIVGMLFGEWLGIAIGVEANVGGVGIAMLLLIIVVDRLKMKNRLSEPTQLGLGFWNAMYIPIVVAMAANQNVVAAIDGGPLAIVTGIAVVIISFLAVPLVSRIGKGKSESIDEGGRPL
ncbi:malonate transporter subunit MadL [Geomicrobium sp. JCM 19038]|uniref:malonate transporter subunit MadL n=1 Tax=Geomicrobium sp. JCM 19038 TaxID=1460635 RepID=UPI00045F1461|nr:malonate transporter subunit MadL [Geomicrobium sp. JCM 19038]GAK06853.1 malonate transporter, MadL subunit [Geomicrobium sp. JCM 19038]